MIKNISNIFYENYRKSLWLFWAFILVPVLVNARQVITLKNNWKFHKGAIENATEPITNNADWENITLPHDWGVGGPFIPDGDGKTGKLPWKDEGWYQTILPVNTNLSNQRIYLLFDGVMAFPEVYINGTLAGKWDYGYNSFYIDITPFLNFNTENILAVHADTRQHESRWYPGGGIYRKVQLIAVDPIHVGIWGTYVTTPIVKSNYAKVRVMTTIENKSDQAEQEMKLEQIIFSPEGNELTQKNKVFNLGAQKNCDVELSLDLINPQRWDLKNPVQYSLKTNIYKNDILVDSYDTKFGIRTIRFTANHGMYLNNKRVQLRGVNLHHDHGPLGAAFYPRAMQRQLEIMKSMGCNAIRTSHNVPAPELLEMCDSMGLLVFDEAFDKYDQKMDLLPDADFEEFAQRNMKNFITRDRNHPSIFIWSVGNEIRDVQINEDNGFAHLHSMVNWVRKYDFSRPITMVSENWESAALRHFDYYDVHSWNYNRRYRLARQMDPTKAVIVSESASTVSTRGFYEFPLPDTATTFTNSGQVSSYDLNAPSWANLADLDFMWQQDEEYIVGEFVWTGFDYLGEPNPYTDDWAVGNGLTVASGSRSSYFGIVDLCGIPKDRYFLYKSLWKTNETTIHILPHWNWPEKTGENVPVFVYTNGDAAELFLNGKSLGIQKKNPISKIATERSRLMWYDVIYEPGELKAIAYLEGVKIGESIIRTADKPSQLKLTADRTKLKNNGNDLSYILVEAFDEKGNLCPLADNTLKIDVKGPGIIAGAGNGNPHSFTPFKSNSVNLFYGKAMIILGTNQKSGEITVTVSSDNIRSEKVQLFIQ